MRIYGIYDMKEKEQCVRIGTLIEIVKFLGMTARQINNTLRKNKLVNNRYQICYLYTEEI